MESGGSSGVIRLGPLARRFLARRRRWLRWMAVALAALTMLTAAAQFRRHTSPAHKAVPAIVVHKRVSARRVYGVAAQVPPGMRAVTLLIPAGTAFAGEMPPHTRIDLLAAFDAGRERVVRQVLVSGIVLGDDGASRPATVSGGSIGAAGVQTGFGAPTVARLSIAIPASREREVAMAQAFGRLFIMVRPAASGAMARANAPRRSRVVAPTAGDHGRRRDAPVALVTSGTDRPTGARPSTEIPATLTMSRYLGLPDPAAPPVAGRASPTGVPAWSAGARAPLPPAPIDRRRRTGVEPSRRSHDTWTVEVIEGTTRSVAVVSSESVP